MKRTEFNIEISAENVLESLGVTRQSELYEEMQEELSELLPGAYEKNQTGCIVGIWKFERTFCDEKRQENDRGIIRIVFYRT